MKKLMFTAIALVAFATSGMANVEKRKENEKEKGKTTEQVLLRKNCASYAATKASEVEAALEAATNTCFSSSDYNALYNFYFSECQG
ncbi:MAG: hypothetical protein ACOVQC_05720 [Flavobacterium sp.]